MLYIYVKEAGRFFLFLVSSLFRIPRKIFGSRWIVFWRLAVIGPHIHETDVIILTNKLRVGKCGILRWNFKCLWIADRFSFIRNLRWHGDCVTMQEKDSNLEQRYISTDKQISKYLLQRINFENKCFQI